MKLATFVTRTTSFPAIKTHAKLAVSSLVSAACKSYLWLKYPYRYQLLQGALTREDTGTSYGIKQHVFSVLPTGSVAHQNVAKTRGRRGNCRSSRTTSERQRLERRCSASLLTFDLETLTSFLKGQINTCIQRPLVSV